MTTTEEEGFRQIPRDFKISNPLPAISPQTCPDLEIFPTESCVHYNNFVKNIIPNFELEIETSEPEAISSMRELFVQEDQSHLYMELEMHLFLVTCHEKQVSLMSNPSLTKFSLLHHDLYLATELINDGKIKIEMDDFCNMMMADTVDLYHNHFSDILEQKFWAKTKTIDDVIKHFLTKEFERLRSLNPFTFQQLTTVAMQKTLDSAPNSGIGKLKAWAVENSINLDG